MATVVSAGDISNAVVLFLVTGVILYGIFRETKPKYVMKDRDTVSQMRLIFYSGLFSLVFTIGTVIVSVQVDKQYSRKGKSIKVPSM